MSMHEIEDLVEESVRCLDESKTPDLDPRSLFKQLYDFQAQYDTGYTHFRVIDILTMGRFTYRLPLSAHPDFEELGPRLVKDGWIHAQPGKPWSESNPGVAYVKDANMYLDAGSPLWKRLTGIGTIEGEDAEPPREMSMDDVVATVVREAASQSKRDLIKAWLMYFVFSQSEEGQRSPGLKRILSVVRRLDMLTDRFHGMPLAEMAPEWVVAQIREGKDDEGGSAGIRASAFELALRKRLPELTPEAIDELLRAVSGAVADALSEEAIMRLPGVVELRARIIPGTPTREGINPFTKQVIRFEGKPTEVEVHAYPDAALREAVAALVKHR